MLPWLFWAFLTTAIAIALLPVFGFAPWTGWITFEEFDLLVLAIASSSYFRAFLEKSDATTRASRRIGTPGYAMLMIVLFGLSLNVSLFRGFADAGGFVRGWYQGYYEPMNNFRLAKSFCWAIVLLPICLLADRSESEKATRLLGASLVVGLGLASLAAIWERLAFPRLLNFSADYRTTALFWEMHVGGAAFDGFLAMTVPFALWMFARSHTKQTLVFYGAILALAGYATLATFSRGVYLAVPLGLAVMAVLAFRRRPANQCSSLPKPATWGGQVMLVYFGMAANFVFPTSGYRGMLAVLISVGLLQPVAKSFSDSSRQVAWQALGLASLVALGVTVSIGSLPKGAYLAFIIGAIGIFVGLIISNAASANRKLQLTLSGYISALIGCVLIAAHWGGSDAAVSMVWVVPMLLLALLVARTHTVPDFFRHWHAGLLSLVLTAALAIATFSGGAYMGNRFSTSSQDFYGRIQHWRGGLGQLEGLDWWFGKGLGRYPVTHFFAAPRSEHPGGYRLENSDDQTWLQLSGGKHINGWGEIFRVTQRIAPGVPPYKVSFETLAEKPVQLHFEVCEKHLLYNAACVVKEISIKAAPETWQKLNVELHGAAPDRSAWFAPRMIAFSVAMETRGGSVKLDNVALYDGLGVELLRNGNFANGLAHWFSSSDKHHMPWHMKSLFFHTLFDQGLVGLALFSMMVFVTIFRLTVGRARGHPLAPAIAGSICGFLVVGLFDSLIDAPRLAALFYLLLTMGMSISGPTEMQSSGRRLHSEQILQEA